jgi:hypothetical protein
VVVFYSLRHPTPYASGNHLLRRLRPNPLPDVSPVPDDLRTRISCPPPFERLVGVVRGSQPGRTPTRKGERKRSHREKRNPGNLRIGSDVMSVGRLGNHQMRRRRRRKRLMNRLFHLESKRQKPRLQTLFTLFTKFCLDEEKGETSNRCRSEI